MPQIVLQMRRYSTAFKATQNLKKRPWKRIAWNRKNKVKKCLGQKKNPQRRKGMKPKMPEKNRRKCTLERFLYENNYSILKFRLIAYPVGNKNIQINYSILKFRLIAYPVGNKNIQIEKI